MSNSSTYLVTWCLTHPSVGHSRFLKSVKSRHRNGPLLVKVFIKPDPALSLRTYHSRLNGTLQPSVIYSSLSDASLGERDNLNDIPNVYSYQVFSETERAGYIIRQWLASSLYDRIRCAASTSGWVTNQLIRVSALAHSLAQLRRSGSHSKSWSVFETRGIATYVAQSFSRTQA